MELLEIILISIIAPIMSIILIIVLLLVCFGICWCNREFFFAIWFYINQKCFKKDPTIGLCKKVYKDIHGQVLEIGPGNGDLFKLLVKNKEIQKWTGIEKNKWSVKFLRHRLSNTPVPFETEIITASSMKDIPSNSIDCVVSRHVFCSLSSDITNEFISELSRVLKVGGSVHIVEHVKFGPKHGCSPVKETGVLLKKNYGKEFEFDLKYINLPMGCCGVIRIPHVYGKFVKKETSNLYQ